MPQGIHGVVLLDKPDGITSQTAVTMVKRALHAQKAGHTGTLDPMATGLLPVCLGEATKYSQDLLDADRKSTRLNSSHIPLSRMPSSA